MNNFKNPRIGRPRLLIIGCGDVGMRMLPLLRERFRVFALTREPQRCAELRAAGAVPILGDLDQPHTLRRLAHLTDRVLHLAPPPGTGAHDTRTRNVCAILPEGVRMVYVSTTGVYGDCGGALVDESRPVAPVNPRARRRVDAETVLRAWARQRGAHLSIFRVPGIYAAERLPFKRLQEGTPALDAADDVFTNHIHADDLARALALALFKGAPGRVYNAVDDTQMKMAEYFDTVADAFGLQRPPRLPRAALEKVVSPVLLSFMSESRRLRNDRLKRELGLRLRYPDLRAALADIAAMASPAATVNAA